MKHSVSFCGCWLIMVDIGGRKSMLTAMTGTFSVPFSLSVVTDVPELWSQTLPGLTWLSETMRRISAQQTSVLLVLTFLICIILIINNYEGKHFSSPDSHNKVTKVVTIQRLLTFLSDCASIPPVSIHYVYFPSQLY